MKVVNNFFLVSKEDMENKQKVVIHDATKLRLRNQQRIYILDKASKARHVTFKEDEVEIDAEEYVVITKDEIRTDVREEKSNKWPKVKIPKNVFVLVDDVNVTELEEKRRKKIKVGHSQIVKANSEDSSENSKESKEIITPRAGLEDGIIRRKQNAIL